MENKYNPYCPVCSGCGEDGCCPATICKHSSDGHYCESYLNDLKFGYKMWMWIEENITFQHEDMDIINEAWDRIYDEVYKQQDK